VDNADENKTACKDYQWIWLFFHFFTMNKFQKLAFIKKKNYKKMLQVVNLALIHQLPIVSSNGKIT